VFQPAAGIVYFEHPVRVVGLGAQADFLDFDLGLLLASLAFLLRSLVEELPKVHRTADGRGGVGGNLHQVEFRLAGDLQGLLDWHDANVLSIGADQANLRNPDGLIYSKFICADKSLLFLTEVQPRGWL